jgi:hypothetical protein
LIFSARADEEEAGRMRIDAFNRRAAMRGGIAQERKDLGLHVC